MNIRQKQLWDNLLALTKANEVFYHQEFTLDGKRYWIFNYRLASYTDFLQPDALECRGHMFEVDQNDQPVRLAAWPCEKFFNLNENPLTIGLDLTKVVRIEDKVDGSLMSTYIHDGVLRLKSRGSLFSDQALAAMRFLETDRLLWEMLYNITDKGYTVNLEWCAPEHRIVIGYPQAHLRVLNVRSTADGTYQDLSQVPQMKNYWVPIHDVVDPVVFVASIKDMTGVEGYVVTLEGGLRVKIKCEWYMSLHHTKDSINNPRRLFESILDEAIDDLRAMFYDDVVAMQMIDEMEKKVDQVYNGMVNMVEGYYAENKHLSRKDYAIKAQTHFKDTLYFGLAMGKYIGRAFSYKTFLKSKWRDLGLKDTSLEEL